MKTGVSGFPRIEIPDDYRDAVAHTQVQQILDRPYLHIRSSIGDDLYLTEFGLPYWKELLPGNMARDREWFNASKVPLPGSSSIFRLQLRSPEEEDLDVVFKWNRMGTDPHLADQSAAFNSPFEEFSLVAEMDKRLQGRFRLQQPLAIYVPSEEYTLEALQRRSSLAHLIQRGRSGEFVDLHREYAVLYAWVTGMDLHQYVLDGCLPFESAEALSSTVMEIMEEHGYTVTDHKMNHLIAPSTADCADLEKLTLIDFELLHRTQAHEYTKRAFRRQRFFQLQIGDQAAGAKQAEPEDGVSVVHGIPYAEDSADSSGGRLWVAGGNGELFDYFLPEKWQETPREWLGRTGASFMTETTDGIRLVIKSSRVGELPIYDPLLQEGSEATEFGYNSPFEEAATAAAMESAGLPVTRLRAIYRLNHVYSVSEFRSDPSRYRSHAAITGTDGLPILQEGRQYLTLWHYWEGTDEELLISQKPVYRPVNLLEVYGRGLLNSKEYETILRYCSFKLETKGFRDLAQKPSHILLMLNTHDELARDETGMPLYRFCNFSLMKPVLSGREQD